MPRSPSAGSADLLAVLRGWSAGQVEDLLALRPDLAAPPPPDLSALAARAGTHASLDAAVHDLPPGPRQVLDALALLAEPTVDLVVALGDPTPTAAEVEGHVADLQRRLLLCPDRLDVPSAVTAVLRYPARIGSGLEQLLPGWPAHAVARLAGTLGLAPERTKALAVRAVLAALADPATAQERLARLSPAALDRLRDLDRQGPVVSVPGLDPARDRYPADDPLLWLVDAGLVVLRGGPYAEVPREVALGLRHPHPFPLAVVRPGPGHPADPVAVAAGSAAAAHRAVALLDAVGAALDAAPVPLLGSGGVGVRELRRLAEPTGAAVADVAVLLETAVHLGLVRAMTKELRLAKAWDRWRARPAEERWAGLAAGWTGVDVPPPPRSGRAQPALKAWPDGLSREVRRRLLQVLAAAPPDRAADLPGWAERYAARWYLEPQPSWGPPRRDPVDVLGDVLAEAALLGLVVDGAPTPLCALTPQSLVALEGVGEERVRAQADGTLVCTGTPSRRVVADLDRLAAVESRGGATVWRISEATLGRAYADGLTAAEALAALERWAGELPQSMRYLVQDAERRAGRLRTGPATSWLVAEDPGALADAVAVLGRLGLTRLAPTVAVSTATPEALREALSRAGLAAVGVGGGAPAAPGKRAPGSAPAQAPAREPVDLVALAARLVPRA